MGRIDPVRAEAAVRELLLALGEDPNREGLTDTPARVARSWSELLAGYDKAPEYVLRTTFEADGYDEMVVLREIDFHSVCEHHMLPFVGVATVGYIPAKRVVGLSKLARLVDCFSRRLQIQERMTRQIGEAIETHLAPLGWGVIVRARHQCMCSRGVQKPRGEMVTSAIGGLIKEDPRARDEFLRFAGV